MAKTTETLSRENRLQKLPEDIGLRFDGMAILETPETISECVQANEDKEGSRHSNP